MRLAAYPAQNGFDGQREFASGSKLWMFLFYRVWLIQIDPAVGTTQQPDINVCAAITAFSFIIRRWRCEAGRHGKILSGKFCNFPVKYRNDVITSEYNSFACCSSEVFMRKSIIMTLMIFSMIGCTNNLQSKYPAITATPQLMAYPTEKISVWSVYDPDPDHLWNRVFRQMYRRVAANGEEYGADELDPLLWFDTTYLLDGVSHQQAIQVLDEFLSTDAENLIRDPLKRAMFQHDLWAVFDWLASQADPYSSQRQALETRIVQLIKRVALSIEEISSLPDNYAFAVESDIFPATVQEDHPEAAFLPSDLFQPNSAWVPMGREGGPIAITHTESFPFFGRSVFLVFVRSPDGRKATLDFINALNKDPSHALTIGSDVALVRRMLLIDDQGELEFSPLIETVQIRHFSPAQNFHEFELNRARLFDGLAGGLVLNTDLFLLFMSHGDVFRIPDLSKATIPQICKGCHFENPPLPNPSNTQSIISYSRYPFSLPDNGKPILFATTLADEAQTVIEWKLNHKTWKSLEASWNQESP